MTPLYSLREVRKRYGPRTVLDLDSLDIQRGEVLAIVGPSGAGKSTLLRLLNFLEPPSAGSLTFDGTPVGDEPPLGMLRRVTTVFQRPVLLDRTVRDNVASDGVVFRPLAQPQRPLDVQLMWRAADPNPALCAVVRLAQNLYGDPRGQAAEVPGT